MKIKYDKETDTLLIQLANKPIEESDQEKKGIIIDYDEAGDVVAIEVLNASKKMDQVNGVLYEMM
ncbi:MAG: DUF2283 domain-containing protein [Bacteroidales bacterium]|nr:DUF2283 domain-containing protein [Bacteroidales bacterium]